MNFACLSAGQLMQRRAQGLSAADGLRLEEHLSSCERCRGQAELLAALVRLEGETFAPLSAQARQRALLRALAGAGSARTPRERAARWPVLLLGAAAAIALASAALLRRQPAQQLAPLAHSAPLDRDRIVSGRVELAGGALAAGQSVKSQAELHTREGAVLALAHAQVELRPESGARWNAGTRTLGLTQGSVLVEVDPSLHRSFAVETRGFTVRVLGTRFEVTGSAVHVLRGRVSVQPKAAGAAALILDAATGPSAYQLPRAAAASLETAGPASPEGARPQPPEQRAVAEQPSGAASLERARALLAARRIGPARRALKLAYPRLQGAALRAEALSLQAECSLLAARYGAARDTYLRVAREFSGLPAAETALYAAARVEAEHGQPERARALLSRYLRSHPHGSFQHEAERRLQSLPAPAPREGDAP